MGIELTGGGDFKLEVTPNNIERIADGLIALLREHYAPLVEPVHHGALQDAVSELVPELTARIKAECRKAFQAEPDLNQRKDLMGRVLIHKILVDISEDERRVDLFTHQWARPLLFAVRSALGEERYDFLNNVLRNTLLNHCVVRDLKTSTVNWNEFYNEKMIDISLKKTKLLRNQLENEADGRKKFLDNINSQIEEGPPFSEEDLDIALHAWAS